MQQIDKLTSRITGRTISAFQEDLETHRNRISDEIRGARVLMIGGAGSIGCSTFRQLACFGPRSLHVIDQNENALAEMVRDLRSGQVPVPVEDLRLLPMDFGSRLMERFLLAEGPYNLILNFAAIKHVRSEKDVHSLLQMLDTNIIKQARFLHWMASQGKGRRCFIVSTDKAANPVNMMGASKRCLEQLLFSGCENLRATSARFANVAFSAGSLLESFLLRISKRQPVAAPRQTKRYFISLEEAGQICLLASVCAEKGTLLIPRFNAANDLIELEKVAELVLQAHGFEPEVYENDEEARASVEHDSRKGRYPLYLTRLDTTGEKPYEEFVGEAETAAEAGMKMLLSVAPTSADPEILYEAIEEIRRCVEEPERQVSKAGLVDILKRIIPEFRHNEMNKSLDDRM